ncbi:MAG: hypothetical protein DMG36_02845 [Acidobacteria bacterium]|nr:MAG: hypothetical protein DMG36_02845 [Acidobacteriota bacterium]
MRTRGKIVAVVAGIAAIALALLGYGLFHGYFDHGQFDIKQMEWSPSKQVAMVVLRTDREALGGLTNFVVIGNHPFSRAELIHAYYSDAVIIAATTTCLTVYWQNASRLDVGCNGSYLERNSIDRQKRESGGITISYENIALK